VWVRILDAREGLLPGSFVRGTVVVERRRSVLTVPRAALRDDARPTISVIRGGVVDVRSVEIGLTEGNRVEVTGGLREGELVVVLGPKDLAAGTRVIVVNQGKR